MVNQFDERELADLIYEFGEERRSVERSPEPLSGRGRY